MTRRAFSVARRGKVERWPIEDWPRWLAACAAEGVLVIHLPGCASPACAGCDGSALGRDPAEARRRARTPEEAHARDARLLPAAQALLARASFTALGDLDGLRRVEVRDGPKRYEVRVDPAWGAAPSCACPEARRPGSTAPCPHAIAVLLSDDELRCQLLEVFL